MALKKSKEDVIRNEQYMDDVVSSVFLNLHRAARRKNDYIWTTKTFTASLDSIWGEPLISKDFDDKNANKTTERLKSQNHGIVSTPSTSGVSQNNQTTKINPNSYSKTGSYYQGSQRNYRSRTLLKKFVETASLDSIWGEPQIYRDLDDKNMEPLKSRNGTIATPSTNRVSRNNQTETKINLNSDSKTVSCYQGSQRNYRSRTLLKNCVEKEERKIDTCCSNETKYSNLGVISDMKTSANKLRENKLKQEVHDSNSDVESRISDVGVYEKSLGTFKKNNSYNIRLKKTENKVSNSVGHIEQTLRFANFENGETSEADKNIVLNSNGSEILSNYPKSKINNPERYFEKPKKSHLSTPVNSLQPVENQKYTKSLNYEERNILKTKLLLKVFKGDKMHDFPLELSDFNRIKKKYPKFQEVFPEINKGEKEIAFSVDALKIVFRFLCNLSYDTKVPDENISIEVLAASKYFEMDKFQARFQKRFLENLKNHSAYKAAVYYNLEDVCNAYKRHFSEDVLSKNKKPYRQGKCFISVSTYIEPREFCIPSKTAVSAYDDNFNRDIRNEITFKAVKGSYVITGFHILLDLDNEKQTDAANLEFSCIVQNLQNSHEEELQREKQCRQMIVINLNRSLVVNEDQTAEIVIETNIKPYLCLTVEEDNIIGICNEGQFNMNIKSTYKVKNSNEKRFFIGKLLYYPKT